MSENMTVALPEFPYAAETEEKIRARMLEHVKDEWDKSEGSFVWDALSPAAIEFTLSYIRAKEVLEWGFAMHSFGGYLDARAAERGIYRRPAQHAVGKIRVQGTPGVYLPEGTLFATEVDASAASELLYYETTEDGTIPAEGVLELKVRCTVEGAHGNVPAHAVTICVSKIAGLSEIANEEKLVDGADEELDEALLSRYLEQVRNPGASGNVADYIRWAFEADTLVGKVRVLPLYEGPGTVNVVIVDIHHEPAGQYLIDRVQAHIDPEPGRGGGCAPIGAHVTVSTPEVRTLDLKVKLTVIKGYSAEAVREDVRKSVEEYLHTLVLNSEDNDVRFSKVGNAIGNTAGVQDFEMLTMSMDEYADVVHNLLVADHEMVVLGTITWL